MGHSSKGLWEVGLGERQACPLRSWPGLGPVVEWRMVDLKAEVDTGALSEP